MASPRVLIVDDHELVRSMLSHLLEQDGSCEVVASASDAGEAVEMATTLRPHVVLMDIDMPGLDSFEAARRMAGGDPAPSIIFLSAYTHDHYIDRALKAGAVGYVTKGSPPATVLEAVLEVAAGRTYFSPEVAKRIVTQGRRAEVRSSPRSRLARLTPREMDVLRYIARGYSKRDIAELMGISPKTVEKHAENLMSRLDIHDRVELARFAIRENLVEP